MHRPDLLVSRVQKAVVEPLSLDHTGQVKSGSILLNGPLLTVGVRNVVPGSNNIQHKVKINENCMHMSWSPDVEGPARNIHCVPIAMQNFGSEPSQFQCLLLQPTGLRQGQFRRYSHIYLNAKDYGIKQWDTVKNEEWLEFEEHDENGIYVITII
jgi:hypothetical protein